MIRRNLGPTVLFCGLFLCLWLSRPVGIHATPRTLNCDKDCRHTQTNGMDKTGIGIVCFTFKELDCRVCVGNGCNTAFPKFTSSCQEDPTRNAWTADPIVCVIQCDPIDKDKYYEAHTNANLNNLQYKMQEYKVQICPKAP